MSHILIIRAQDGTVRRVTCKSKIEAIRETVLAARWGSKVRLAAIIN